ncbi:Imm26 family immunity protein [Intrasporangium sp. YIM S08009]|uniref:Imm26 family immunity protein n=1 Tax=Intrasporangium zincisolvens TaxID=3080018 RepID=UPI002B05EFC7|nr:Imm26 family immunity protein [Intrasporangium sp. YIM S08009]
MFTVPLRTDGLAIGVVGRASTSSILFGFFFGPRRNETPPLDSLGELTPAGAALIGRFGHLGLRDGRWPVLGTLPDWDRSRWAMPTFARREPITGATFSTRYDDQDPARLVGEERVREELVACSPDDGLMGAGFVEIRLTRLLD